MSKGNEWGGLWKLLDGVLQQAVSTWNVLFPGNVTITGTLEVDGAIQLDGAVTAPGDNTLGDNISADTTTFNSITKFNGMTKGIASSTITGTVSCSSTTTLTGSGTQFLTELKQGDRITVGANTRLITAIASATSLTTGVAFGTFSAQSATRLPAIQSWVLSDETIAIRVNETGDLAFGGLNDYYIRYISGSFYVVASGNTTLRLSSSEVEVSQNMAFINAKNIAFATSTGTKIGTDTLQKIGFWNATPIVQPSGAAQAAPAAYGTGVFGLDSEANMQALYDLVVAMRTAMVNAGLMKGSA